MYAESCYFIYADSCPGTEKSFILFLQKGGLGAEAACVSPGSSKRIHLPLSAFSGSWTLLDSLNWFLVSSSCFWFF